VLLNPLSTRNSRHSKDLKCHYTFRIGTFLCGLLALLVWLMRKGKLASLAWTGVPGHSAVQLDLIARRVLTSRHVVHLISAAGESFLIVTYPDGVEIAALPVSRHPNPPIADLREGGRL